MKTVVCTIVGENYLRRARALEASIRALHPDLPFRTLVVDGRGGSDVPGDMVHPEEARRRAAAYDVTELSCSIKPNYLAHLLREYEAVVYVDPDGLFLNSADELLRWLEEFSIILTPHLLTPVPLDRPAPNELAVIRSGTFNLGFIAVRGTPDVGRFLAWWAQRTAGLCKVDFGGGLFFDQKWIDLVPGYFERVLICRKAGYNVAYWNVFDRDMRFEDGRYTVNGEPLVFYHFSGFDPRNPQLLSRFQPSNPPRPPALQTLLAHYTSILR